MAASNGQSMDNLLRTTTVVPAVSDLELWTRLNIGLSNNFEVACECLDLAVDYNYDNRFEVLPGMVKNMIFTPSKLGAINQEIVSRFKTAIAEKNPNATFRSLCEIFSHYLGYDLLTTEETDASFKAKATACIQKLNQKYVDLTFIDSDRKTVHDMVCRCRDPTVGDLPCWNRSSDIADQDSIADALMTLRSDGSVALELSNYWKKEATEHVHTAFFLAHGEVVDNQHNMYFESKYSDTRHNKWRGTDWKLYLSGSSEPVTEDQINQFQQKRSFPSLVAIKSPSIILYCKRWMKSITGLTNRHLIIVADLCNSGQLINDLDVLSNEKPNDNSPSCADFLKNANCSITIQACCAEYELAKGSYFAPTWIKLNKQLFGDHDGEQYSVDKKDLYAPPDVMLQHPCYLTIGQMPENLKGKICLLDSSQARATYETWLSYLSPHHRDSIMNIEQYYRIAPNRAHCTQILKEGKYSIKAVKFFISKVCNAQLQIAALICPTDRSQKWIQHVHIDTMSVLPKWRNGGEELEDLPGWELTSGNIGHVPIEAFDYITPTNKNNEILVICPYEPMNDKKFREYVQDFLRDNKNICLLESFDRVTKNVEFYYVELDRADSDFTEFLDGHGIFYNWAKEIISEHPDRSRPVTQDITWGKSYIRNVTKFIRKYESVDVLIKNTKCKISVREWWAGLEMNDIKRSEIAALPNENSKRGNILSFLSDNWSTWASIPAGLRRTRYPPALYQGPYTED